MKSLIRVATMLVTGEKLDISEILF